MLDWPEYRKELVSRIGDIAKLSPDTVTGYQTLSNAGKKTGTLDAKTRELIALAVALNAGAALVYSARVMDAVGAYEAKPSS